MGKINRRTFLEEVTATKNLSTIPLAEDAVYQKYVNKSLPKGLNKTTGTLNQYTGPWTETEAIHLLRRTMFGVRYGDLQTITAPGVTMSQAVDMLLNVSTTAPTPPLNNYQAVVADPTIPLGQTWVTAPYDSNTAGQ